MGSGWFGGSSGASDVTNVCLTGMLVKSSLYMGNGWLGRAVISVMPLMSVLCECLQVELAGFDVIGGTPKISARYVDRGCSQRIKTRNVDLECFSIPRASIHGAGRSVVYLGIRCQNVLCNAMKST